MSQYSVTTVLNQIFYHTFPYVGRAHGRGRGGPASLHVGLFILSVKGTDGGWGRGRGRDQAQGGDLEARQLGTGKRFVAFTQPVLIFKDGCCGGGKLGGWWMMCGVTLKWDKGKPISPLFASIAAISGGKATYGIGPSAPVSWLLGVKSRRLPHPLTKRA